MRSKNNSGFQPLPVRGLPAGGFTLIEMLVVIAIIALLAGLIVPAVSKALKRAERVQCASQMREIHHFMSLYLVDHDGKYPPFDNIGGGPYRPWREFLYKYSTTPTKEDKNWGVWLCPSKETKNMEWWRYLVYYGANSRLSGKDLSSITNPSMMLEVIDTTFLYGNHSISGSGNTTNVENWIHFRHINDTANILYCDGHVNAVPRSALITDIIPAFNP